MINKENVYNQIKKSGNLPTLPEILLKLLEACDNDATPLSEIASIISKDPALSLRVLQLVNSSYYGLRSTFTGVYQAVVYLGANSIKNIAVTASVNQVFERKQFKAVKQFNIRTFWWQSLMCATFARRIAKKVGFDSIEEAYLSGLLHDIGKLVLVSTFPNEYNWFLLDTEVVQNELWAETELIGITHCEAGSWLVRNWKLDSLMADAIRYHHEPLEQIKEAFLLVKIVYISNMLRETSHNDIRNCEAGNLLLGLDTNDLRDIVDGATEEMQQIAENLNINVKAPSTIGKSLQKDVQQAVKDKESVTRGMPGEILPSGSPGHNDTGGQEALTARIKNITLLSGFLENLVQAGDSEAIIAVFEQSMSILFDIEKVLFFLPDKDCMLLRGRTSPASSLQHLSRGLTLPVKQSSSMMAKAFLDTSLMYLTRENKQDNLADKQVLAAFRCDTVLIVPIIADKKPLGVILLGLPESVKALSKNDSKLIHVIVQQVGLCLFLEKMKTKKAEELETERMAAVSMAARKLAHEINNPLGIITNCLTTMTLKLLKENDTQEEIRLIGEEINRISSMVNQMDMFSQAAFTLFELTDVNAVIEDIIHIVKSSLFIASGTVIHFRPDAMLPQIMTSRDAIKQVMINLLKNASEAMNDGGIIEVKTGMFSNLAHGDQGPKADGIEIIVEDTGPGLPDSIVKGLFKPIVTTKENGHYGLGLSIVHKAVKDLGGSISYANTPAKGASFSIYLPLKKKDFI
jgi:HD-like signal output (HDOD) protein/nitrogen-specific signal transduction histidine kinase